MRIAAASIAALVIAVVLYPPVASQPTYAAFSSTIDSSGLFKANLTYGTACELPGPDNFGYRCKQVAYQFDDISGTGTKLVLLNDELSASIPIGFSFKFYNSTRTVLKVSSNGWLTLLTSTTTSGCCNGAPIPSSAVPNLVIAGLWADLNPAAGGAVYYQTKGVSPNRNFTVLYKDVPHSPNNNPVTFEVVLSETTNNIRINYKHTATNGVMIHSAGIENETGTDGLRFRRSSSFALNDVSIKFDRPGAPGPMEVLGPEEPPMADKPIIEIYRKDVEPAQLLEYIIGDRASMFEHPGCDACSAGDDR